MKHIAPLLFVATLGVAACGADTEAAGPTTTTPPTTASPAGTSTPIGSVPAGTKVSANDASTEEITAALAAAGVENPDAWADEIVEHRPYATDDPSLQDLRDALAEYDPPAATMDQMVSALTP